MVSRTTYSKLLTLLCLHRAFHSYLAAVEMPRKWADSTKQGKIEPDVTLWSEQFGYTGKMNYWQYLESAGLTQRFATVSTIRSGWMRRV